MAGTMTITIDEGLAGDGARGGIKRMVCAWTSDGSGDADATSVKVSGQLVKAVTDPSATAPTANYDIVITDDASFNVLTNTDDDLMDRHTSTTEEVYFFVLDHAGTPLAQSLRPAVNSPLTVTVSNAGDTKSGTLYLYYEG